MLLDSSLIDAGGISPASNGLLEPEGLHMNAALLIGRVIFFTSTHIIEKKENK